MTVRIETGDCLEVLRCMAEASVDCCVTSPPYFGLRDYGHAGQIGIESTPTEYIARLTAVFSEVRRVLKDEGTLWLNIGDSYASSPTGSDSVKSGLEGGKRTQVEGGKRQNKIVDGLKPKDLIGIPWRLAMSLQADGWYLRSDIIWHKPNAMPESVKDRPTNTHEYVFLLSKSQRYFYDHAAIAEGSGNKRSVWSVPTKPYKGAHFATFPPDLISPCIQAGCPLGGTVLDPFGGAGTTGLVADALGRDSLLIELNPEYSSIARGRIAAQAPLFAGIA